MNREIDVLVVSAGNTPGWVAAANELADSMRRAGASVELITADRAPTVRTFALTDFVQAREARRACSRALAQYRPTAIVYCSITAALLWPRPGAISVDSIAAENRPGRHGFWQRPVERRRLRRAPLILAWSERSLAPRGGRHADVVVCPVPVEGGLSECAARDVEAVVYAGDPVKRRLDHVLEQWSRARRDRERLMVVGTDRAEEAEGIEVAGRLPEHEFRALLARARLFLAAPRREDYGVAALEALASGCQLVGTPAPGPYPALRIARELDPRLIDENLETAIRTALDDPLPGYARRAAELLAPFSRAAVDRTIAEEVLPRLLPGFTASRR